MTVKRSIASTVGCLMLFGAVGCQTAHHAPLAEQPRTDIAVASTADPAQRLGQRTHVLLASYEAEAPTMHQADDAPHHPPVRLRAGDALGDQMFQRYAAQMRTPQHEAEPQRIAHADQQALLEQLATLFPQVQ